MKAYQSLLTSTMIVYHKWSNYSEKPILRVEQAQEGYNDLLAVRLDIGEEARHLAVAYDEIAKAAMDGQRAIALDEDTILLL